VKKIKLLNMTDQNKKKQINIELSEEMAEGTYANMFMIGHSNSEFIIDFIKWMPGVAKAKVKSRIILTPQHAKRLLRALQDNINKYESMFGTIEVPEGGGEMMPPFNLGSPTTEA
jgi:hypothetical protein